VDCRIRIIKIFIELFEIDESAITDNTILNDYFDGTDLDIIDLIEAIESEFDITVYDGDLLMITTFGELVQYVETKLEKGH